MDEHKISKRDQEVDIKLVQTISLYISVYIKGYTRKNATPYPYTR